MKQADTKLAKAIRDLQNEVEEKTLLLEALRKDYNPEEIDFYSYIKTQAWEEMRQKIFRRDGFKCVVCGEAKNLNVHHITYDNLGAEKESDLVTLCHACHERTHAGDPVEKQIQMRRDALAKAKLDITNEIKEHNLRVEREKIDNFMNPLTRKLFAYAIALGEDYFKLEDDYKIDSLYLDNTTWLYGFVKHFNEGKPIDEYEWIFPPPFEISSLPDVELDKAIKNDKDFLMREYKHLLGVLSVNNVRHFLDVETKSSKVQEYQAKYALMTKLAYGVECPQFYGL